ncbi:glycoside hydrolase family 76 protein [Streptomyces sp. NPDC059166]|uniref:glycoside hydrolase family 76 protein n=1 Tax=unclassified Streptomyces TaxID=2593676 RepID=UPI0036ACDCC9
MTSPTLHSTDPDAVSARWYERADRIQDSLDRYFGTEAPQLFDNWRPLQAGDNETFNYWWLAHVIDARLDAYLRSQEPGRLDQARTVHANILERNGGSLFNDYFDDMLWYAIATLRLAEAETGEEARLTYLAQAEALWRHVHELGWNEQCGGGIAWRKSQLYYKNTPSNGTFVILSARLHRHTGRPEYLLRARETFDWLTRTLLRPDGFVEDGLNRQEDGKLDTQWEFTYNQGLYIGACVELAATIDSADAANAGEAEALLDRALATDRAAYARLAVDGVPLDDGDGGDEGLFKGILMRYAGLLAQALDAAHRPSDAQEVRERLLTATGVLWDRALCGEELLAGPDWRKQDPGHFPYSAQVSAIMATEQAALLTRAAQR